MKLSVSSMFLGVFALAMSLNVAAASEDSIWSSEVEVGAFFSSGNSEEKNFKFRGEGVRDGEVYVSTVKLSLLNSSTDDQKTAQKTYGVYKLDRKLSDVSTIFGRLAYEDDKFSGFDYQVDFTAGYTRKLIQTDVRKLDASIGLGYRQSELETGGSEDEIIIRLAGDYVWQVSDNATFKQALSVEIGDFATITRSGTSLSADVLDDLALKLALDVKSTSEVPAGRDKTDVETALTLLYKF